jgi:uncharacterized protein RhaS with RHS repeats
MAEAFLKVCGLRYYDSAAGRWLNRDPISYAGGVNVYEYCGNGPVGMSDASGMMDGPWVPPRRDPYAGYGRLTGYAQ